MGRLTDKVQSDLSFQRQEGGTNLHDRMLRDQCKFLPQILKTEAERGLGKRTWQQFSLRQGQREGREEGELEKFKCLPSAHQLLGTEAPKLDTCQWYLLDTQALNKGGGTCELWIRKVRTEVSPPLLQRASRRKTVTNSAAFRRGDRVSESCHTWSIVGIRGVFLRELNPKGPWEPFSIPEVFSWGPGVQLVLCGSWRTINLKNRGDQMANFN